MGFKEWCLALFLIAYCLAPLVSLLFYGADVAIVVTLAETVAFFVFLFKQGDVPSGYIPPFEGGDC